MSDLKLYYKAMVTKQKHHGPGTEQRHVDQ